MSPTRRPRSRSSKRPRGFTRSRYPLAQMRKSGRWMQTYRNPRRRLSLRSIVLLVIIAVLAVGWLLATHPR